jgi:hypothetical protein
MAPSCLRKGNPRSSSLEGFRQNGRRISYSPDGKIETVFNFVKLKTKENPPIPTLRMPDTDAEYQTAAAKSEAFSEFFASVFSTDNGISLNFGSRTQRKLDRVVFTEQKVLASIKNCKSSFAAGPDGLHSFFLKRIGLQIARPLALIFNLSMETGVLPKMWLEALIVPTAKSRKRHLVTEYRPISLTCVCSKLMESIVRDEVASFLNKNSLLTPHQHGFMKKKSTFTQLLECFQDWINSVNEGHPIDIIYLDFKKAFDSVVHAKLIENLGGYGITGDLLTWCKMFLSDRTQQVRVEDAVSGTRPVKSGVPQGSVLGPLFFIIFINDIMDIVDESKIQLYADDIKLYRKIVNRILDRLRLQADLTNVGEWSNENQLPLAEHKCKSISVFSSHGREF